MHVHVVCVYKAFESFEIEIDYYIDCVFICTLRYVMLKSKLYYKIIYVQILCAIYYRK